MHKVNLVTLFVVFCFLLSCGGGDGGNDVANGSGSWTHSTNLATDAISVSGQDAWANQVAMDSNDNAIIAWYQSDGANTRIFMSEYRNGNWTHPVNLATDAISVAGQDAYFPHVAMDNNGNAIITWVQSDGMRHQIYMSEYRNGSWTHPSDLANDAISIAGQSAYPPTVAMDNNGDAIIIWGQYDGTTEQVYMSEYRNGSWTHPSDLANDAISIAGQNALFPQVAMDDIGNAIITWSQYDGDNDQAYMSEYRKGSWVHPTNLATDAISVAGHHASPPLVAMDNNDNAIIAWQQHDGNNYQIYMSECRNGSWVHPTDLATDAISVSGQNAAGLRAAMDDNNNAIVVWQQQNGNNYQVYMSEYRNGSWNHPADLATDNISIDGQDVSLPDVAMDNNGNAIITWSQYDGENYQAYMSEYRKGSWAHPTSLATGAISVNGQDAHYPQVAMNDNDNAIIALQQQNGSNYQTYKSEYR